ESSESSGGGGGGGGSGGGSSERSSKGKSKTPALDSFGRDLTELARQSKLDPVIGRHNEIERVIQVLSRRTKNNPVLLGEAGAGEAEGGSDAWNGLKPALPRGQIQYSGASTLDECRKYLEQDGALEQGFQQSNLNPPPRVEALGLHKGVPDRCAAQHRGEIKH